MPKNFKTLQAKMSPESRQRSEAKARRILEEMALDELRQAREMTQTKLAETLGVNQSEISKIEHRTDLYVSTLAQYVQALGGRLEIRASFPEGDVRITQFEKLSQST